MYPSCFQPFSRPRTLPPKPLLGLGLALLLVSLVLGYQFIDLDNNGLSHGFNHPLDGWDHLLTMLAVGVWAAQLRGRAIWMLPLAFVSVMSLGGLAGAAGLSIPSVEGLILLSCGIFAVLVTRNIRFSNKINVLIVAFFGFFHGFAHGQEISTSASLISYTVGFILATLLLHGAGILLVKLVLVCIACILAMVFAGPRHAVSASSAAHTAPIIAAGFEQLLSPWQAEGLSRQQASTPQLNDSSGQILCKNRQQADLQVLLPASRWAVMPRLNHPAAESKANVNLRLLGFSHYYPSINYSPGIDLLGNGVGRTSPPLAVATISKLSPQKFLPLYSKLEAIGLQFVLSARPPQSGTAHLIQPTPATPDAPLELSLWQPLLARASTNSQRTVLTHAEAILAWPRSLQHTGRHGHTTRIASSNLTPKHALSSAKTTASMRAHRYFRQLATGDLNKVAWPHAPKNHQIRSTNPSTITI
ncbi:hypothetical protein A1353_05650 [Methylomonas methanica]|uniref:Urease accessory protein n=1 Tax=Methylomonas methanica TaxID=421 RepID=A0A177MVW5_METMH|nr:HupE/UreJ family protein [Methylomonas methanica]OAI09049.1 hypothetical protein A1353_05650 [Methylomonas methanica]